MADDKGDKMHINSISIDRGKGFASRSAVPGPKPVPTYTGNTIPGPGSNIIMDAGISKGGSK